MEEGQVSDIQNDLIFNFFIDQKKRKVDYIARAKLLRKYLDSKKMTIRALGRELEIANSTLQDWLLWDRVNEHQYEQLKEQYKTDTQIYRKLRNNKDKPVTQLIKETEPIDIVMENLRLMLSHTPTDKRIIQRLEEAKNLINRIIMHIERH